MSKARFAAIVGCAFSVLFVSGQPAFAQDQDPARDDGRRRGDIPSEQVLPGRIGGDRNVRREDRERRNQQNRRGQQASPEEAAAANLVGAQAVIAAAGVSCEATEARLVGAMPDGGQVYEAVCAGGPGYVLVGSTPPAATDCVSLAGALFIARETDPEAAPGVQCELPANLDHLAVITTYAREAGVACTVDQGLAIGVGRYEVGCAGAAGYWVERNAANGWDRTSCLTLDYAGAVCRFTTPDELTAIWPGLIARASIADCAPEAVRYIGLDGARNIVVEVKCAADRGYIVRADQAFDSIRRSQTCWEGRGVGADENGEGGGCTLSAVIPPEDLEEEE